MTSSSAEIRRIAITNVLVFDGTTLNATPRTVIIEGDHISSSSNLDGTEQIIDGSGCTLLPGLIDAHVHLHSPEEDLRNLASHGITTVFNMGAHPRSKLDALRDMSKRKGMPSIISAGLQSTAKGSLHSKVMNYPPEAMVENPDQAKAYVKGRKEEGGDFIKLIADIPGPSQETMNAIVENAHHHDGDVQSKQVVVHAATLKPFKMAVDSKADYITHSPVDGMVTDEMVQDMVETNQVIIPTLVMMEATSKPAIPSVGKIVGLLARPAFLVSMAGFGYNRWRSDASSGPWEYSNSRESVTKMIKAGIPVLAGTDANSSPGSPFKVPHGQSLHRELELLVEAGLSTIEALRSATSLPARYFGLEDRGVVREGKRADLVLVEGDPVKDLKATRATKRIWIGGVEVEPAVGRET